MIVPPPNAAGLIASSRCRRPACFLQVPVGNGQRAVRVGRMRHRKHRPRNSEILEMAPDDLPLSVADAPVWCLRSEEHTSELQSLMRISYAVFCLKKKKTQ